MPEFIGDCALRSGKANRWLQNQHPTPQLNFAGGLCIIEHGLTPPPSKLAISDRLTCYSGADEIATFDVYGRETVV